MAVGRKSGEKGIATMGDDIPAKTAVASSRVAKLDEV
jgi:hypothetical protein